MIGCSEIRKLAGEILEGGISHEASTHLSACPRCKAFLGDLKAIRSAAQKLPRFEPRPELWQAIEARAFEEGLIPTEPLISCEEFFPLAGDVLDGDSHPQAFEHLRRCADCKALVHDLDSVARAAHSLPEYEPRASLWYKIRAQAREESLWQEEAWWERLVAVPQPAFAAAVATLLLALGLGLVGSPFRFPLPEYGDLSAANVAHGELVSNADFSNRYQVHLIQVERAMLDENTLINDEMIDLVEKPLDTVERALVNTRQALVKNPNDTFVQDELNRLYKQKATVLQAMADLSWQEYGD